MCLGWSWVNGHVIVVEAGWFKQRGLDLVTTTR
jgi:hypothetical protein